MAVSCACAAAEGRSAANAAISTTERMILAPALMSLAAMLAPVLAQGQMCEAVARLAFCGLR